MVKCPECKKIIIATDDKGTRKLRSRILLFEEGQTIAICPQCKTRVIVPVFLEEKAKKPISHIILQKKLANK